MSKEYRAMTLAEALRICSICGERIGFRPYVEYALGFSGAMRAYHAACQKREDDEAQHYFATRDDDEVA